MVLAANALRIRRFFGLLTLILGGIDIVLSVSLGIVGLVMYFIQGDLLMLGNPGAGPSVALTLIIEGFLLELVLALTTTLFGHVVKGHLHPSLIVLKEAMPNVEAKGELEEDEVLEGSPYKKRKTWRRLENLKKDFEVEAPKCLWISLLLLAGMNLALSLTCYLLASGNGSTGMGLAMRHYGMDPAVRRAVDWVQQEGECCGDQVYTEWLSEQWCTERPNLVPSEVGPPAFINVCGPKHRSVNNDVPQSCCTPVRSPCIHDPLDLLGLGPLHNDGCSTYIEALLDPLYIGIAKFHLFLFTYKFLLVALVLILRYKEDTHLEKVTDEEAKHLLDDEDAPGVKAEGGAGPQAKASTKSWLSALSKKKPAEASKDPSPAAGEEDAHGEKSGPKAKKLWHSAVKMTQPLKRMSRVIGREEGKPERTRPLGIPQVDMEASAPQSEGVTARVASPSSHDQNGGRFEARLSDVSRAKSFDAGPVSPRPVVRGSFSEWRWSSTEAAVDGDRGAAKITPSKHEEHRLSVGAVN